jgi:hypothetical protein
MRHGYLSLEYILLRPTGKEDPIVDVAVKDGLAKVAWTRKIVREFAEYCEDGMGHLQ